MAGQDKTLVLSLIEEVWSWGNFGVADEIVAGDYVGHSSPIGTETHGTAGYKQFFVALRRAFPDLQVTVEDQIAEGDKVVCRWTARATHQGEYAGIPPTGGRGVVTGTTIYRITGGKAAECWTNSDDLGLLQQIGAIPVLGQTA